MFVLLLVCTLLLSFAWIACAVFDCAYLKRGTGSHKAIPITTLGRYIRECLIQSDIEVHALKSQLRVELKDSSGESNIQTLAELVKITISEVRTSFPYAKFGVMAVSTFENISIGIHPSKEADSKSYNIISGFLSRALETIAKGDTLESPQTSSLSSIGIRDSLIVPIKGGSSSLIIWIGYTGEHHITQIERDRLKQIAYAIFTKLEKLETALLHKINVSKVVQESERKSAFLSQISHDIRSPLSTIKSVLDLITGRPSIANDRELMDGAIASCDMVKNLVEDLVEFAQLKAGVLTPTQKICRFSSILSRCVSPYKIYTGQKGIKFGVNVESDPELLTDPKHLSRILSNLISNACKYTRAGEIEVKVSAASDGRVVCAVTDTGIGMNPAQQKLLFQPFSRLHEDFEGIGLGLVICRGLAELNGYELTVESESGRGSTFKLFVKTRSQSACPTTQGAQDELAYRHAHERLAV